MLIVRQNTARTILIGPVLDANGVAVTDCVVGDFKISRNGGAPAALDTGATLTHRHTGHYSLALTANDLDTVGIITVTLDDTTNACAPAMAIVIEETVYDALFADGASGYQVPIWSAPSSTVDLSGTTIKAVTDGVTLASNNPLRIRKNQPFNGFAFFMRNFQGELLTGLSVTAQRSLDGGSFASCSNSVTEIGSGAYKIDLTASDLNGNVVLLLFTASGAAPLPLMLVTQL